MKKKKLKNKTLERSSLTTGEAARHCQVSVPALRQWVQDGRLRAFKTPGGHCRIDLKGFQRFLQHHGMPAYPTEPPNTRILIADDETLITDLLVEFLTDDPRRFKLETAMDGYEALIKLGIFKPSLLILDAAMPRLNGIQACRRLKADPETRTIKILGITGYPEMIPALLEAGADACLTKPLDLPKVKQEVDRLLPSDS